MILIFYWLVKVRQCFESVLSCPLLWLKSMNASACILSAPPTSCINHLRLLQSLVQRVCVCMRARGMNELHGDGETS